MQSSHRRLATNVLVIGTGGAGLRASIELAERGVDVLAVGKRRRHDAHTSLAAGGINAALATMDPQDSWPFPDPPDAEVIALVRILAGESPLRLVSHDAEDGERRRVLADDGDAHGHRQASTGDGVAAEAGRVGCPVTSANAASQSRTKRPMWNRPSA